MSAENLDFDAAVAATLQPAAPSPQSARLGFVSALDTNPDAQAEARRVARSTGVPLDTALNLPADVKKQARLGEIDFDALVQTSPATAALLADVERAKVAHDDVENLSALETALRATRDTGRAAMAGLYGGSAGVVGGLQAGTDLLSKYVTRPLAGTLLPQDIGGAMSDGLADYRRSIEATRKQWMPQTDGVLSAGWYGGIASMTQNLANLPFAIATGNPTAALAPMVGQVFGQSYGEARDKGLNVETSLSFGASQAAVEYATEKLPVGRLVKDLAGNAGFGRMLARQMAAEVPGEQVATVLQDLNEWAVLNPEKSFGDYLAERPSAAAQTLVATLVGTGGQISVIKGVELAANRLSDKREQAAAAGETADLLARLDQFAAASALRGREVETFEQFVAAAAEDGPVENLYIDAEVLNQSGIAEQLAQASPAVAEQLQEALATGGQVRIPVAEYAARVAGTELAAPLLDHLKTDPAGFSRAEAQAYMQTEGAALEAEIATVFAEQEADAAFRASADVVRDKVRTELDAAGRFAAEPNDAYATLVGNFYAVTAGKLGLTPEQFYERFPLGVRAESVAGGEQFEQVAIESPAFREWFGGSRVIDSEGKPMVTYHTTEADFDTFDLDRAYLNEGFWFSDSPSPYAGEGSVTMPVYLSLQNPYIAREADGTDGVDPGAIREAGQYDGVIYEWNDGTRHLVAFRPEQIKSAIGNRGTYDPNDPNILNQFAGPSAATADTHALDTAQRRIEAGEDAETVRQETGWHRGPDGKWRFEIDDSGAKVLPALKSLGSGGYDAREIVSVTYRRRDDGTYDLTLAPPNPKETSDFVNLTAVQPEVVRAVLPDEAVQAIERGEGAEDVIGDFEEAKRIDAAFSFEGFNALPLDQVIEHPALFAAYPALREIMVQVDTKLGVGGSFSYVDHADGTTTQLIRIGKGRQLSTLLHEIQHGIQAIEGFARGGSPEAMAERMPSEQAINDAKVLRARIDRGESAGEARAWFLNTLGRDAVPEASALAEEMSTADLHAMASSPREAYRRLAGEVEARNTEARAALTADERRSTAPSATADVADDRVVVMFNGREMANAPMPANAKPQAARGSYSPSQNLITLLKGADLSTFLHESGHAFLEIQTTVAAQIARDAAMYGPEKLSEGERQLLRDTDALLAWFGVADLDTWQAMPFEERRAHHEKFARGFEAYLFEGRAPAIEMQSLFARFRSWLLSVYRSLSALNVELTDEVRGVMDRMLATDEQIKLAEQGRSMMPLFESAEAAGMTTEAFAAYQALGQEATGAAQADLAARGLRDMQWLRNARGRVLKQLQKEAAARRAEVQIEARREVMRQPVYRAWAFLTAKLGADDKVTPVARPKSDPDVVDPALDSLFVAIAKLGGLDRAQLETEWGLDKKERVTPPLFGKHVLRRTDGLSIDDMRTALAQYGYLSDEAAEDWNPREFEDAFMSELGGSPVYSSAVDHSVLQDARPGEGLNPEGAEAGRLDRAGLADIGLPAEIIEHLVNLKMTARDGWHPDLLAETFGFSSGDEMARTLAAAPAPKDAIEAETDRRMLERFGELATPAAIERAADSAIHNEARARFVATELRALEQATGSRKVLTSAAREFARQMIARRKIRHIRSGEHGAAETRAAKAAEAALKAGNGAQAAAEKRNQLINLYAARAAHDALDEVEAGVRYLRRFEREGTRKGLDAEYLEQIDDLLDAYDLRRGQSLRAIDKRQSFAEWAERQREMGLDPTFDADLLDAAKRQHYKNLTLEEFRGIVDAAKNIEHLGRLKKKLLTAKDAREFAAIVAEAEESIREHGGDARPVQVEEPTGFKPWLEGAKAGHRKFASLLRQMDGGQDGGPLWRILGRGMNEAATAEAVMIERATERLAELYAPILALPGGAHGAKQFIPEINASLTRGGRLAVALNWGNATNRQRVMGGDNWTEAQVEAILRRLTRAEWEFVQNTWAFIDGYWDDIAAKEKRVTGVVPEKVEALPFQVTTAEGDTLTLAGGYYPIKYDANRDDRAEKHDAAAIADDMKRGAFTRSTTRRGHTKARVDEVRRPVRKSLDVITQHVAEVAHDLAWHEWLIDANRLIDARPINAAIREHYGTAVVRTMKDMLTAIATADVVPQTKIDQALLYLRANVSRSTMGLSLTTALLQPFGLTQSMVRIGPQHVLRGLARWGGDAARFESSLAWIRGKSDFMRLRAKTFNRELHEIKGRVSHGHSKARQIYDASLFMLMQKMQLVADVPTWIGAYEKARAEGLDDDTAVAQADQAVLDSQGGGQTKDMAEFQRKHPMLTMFYSYFNVTYNLAAESTARTDFRNPLAVAGWISDMLLLMVIPALGPALIMELLRGGGGDDEPEDWAKKLVAWQAGYLLGTVIGVREFSGLVSGYDYAGPPVGRVVADLGSLGKQIGQGELDENLALSSIRLMGTAIGVPTVQLLRSWRGWRAWEDGDAPATAILLGPPPKE